MICQQQQQLQQLQPPQKLTGKPMTLPSQASIGVLLHLHYLQVSRLVLAICLNVTSYGFTRISLEVVSLKRCRLRMEQIPQVLVMDQSVFGT